MPKAKPNVHTPTGRSWPWRPTRSVALASLSLALFCLLWLGPGCGAESTCENNRDCPPDERCVSNGSFFADRRHCLPDVPDCDRAPDREGCFCARNNSQRRCWPGKRATRSVGACEDGAQFCEDGVWEECLDPLLPAEERCGNLIDDDCDGETDEGC